MPIDPFTTLIYTNPHLSVLWAGLQEIIRDLELLDISLSFITDSSTTCSSSTAIKATSWSNSYICITHLLYFTFSNVFFTLFVIKRISHFSASRVRQSCLHDNASKSRIPVVKACFFGNLAINDNDNYLLNCDNYRLSLLILWHLR